MANHYRCVVPGSILGVRYDGGQKVDANDPGVEAAPDRFVEVVVVTRPKPKSSSKK